MRKLAVDRQPHLAASRQRAQDWLAVLRVAVLQPSAQQRACGQGQPAPKLALTWSALQHRRHI